MGSPGSYKITTYVELTTAATRGYPDWSVVCCVETVGQSNTRQQVGSTFYLNHSAAGQSAAQKTTHVCCKCCMCSIRRNYFRVKLDWKCNIKKRIKTKEIENGIPTKTFSQCSVIQPTINNTAWSD